VTSTVTKLPAKVANHSNRSKCRSTDLAVLSNSNCNRRHSVDADIRHGGVTVSMSFLLTSIANILVMHNSKPNS